MILSGKVKLRGQGQIFIKSPVFHEILVLDNYVECALDNISCMENPMVYTNLILVDSFKVKLKGSR